MDDVPTSIVWVTVENRLHAATFNLDDDLVTTHYGRILKTAQTAGCDPRRIAEILLREMVEGISGDFGTA